jgi:hypothetical protein
VALGGLGSLAVAGANDMVTTLLLLVVGLVAGQAAEHLEPDGAIAGLDGRRAHGGLALVAQAS